MQNNESLATLQTEQERHKEKIGNLEIIYQNRQSSEDPASGASKPVTIFDTIHNKIADNAAECREREQAIQGQVNLIRAHQEEITQNVEV